MSLVDVSGLTKTYQSGELDVPVLRGVDLQVEAGEYLALMGRSGAGKSTLMNILGCLDRPTAGQYRLSGEEVGGLSDEARSLVRGRQVGFVFQSFHLLRGMTVLENVELPLEYSEVSPEEGRERALELLDRVGLSHRLRHRPTQLSGGENQRVAIARALINRPRLLLADEPTGNLDIRAQGRILDLFAELREETGVTLVMVTHDPAIAETVPRCVVVAEGRIAEDRR